MQSTHLAALEVQAADLATAKSGGFTCPGLPQLRSPLQAKAEVAVQRLAHTERAVCSLYHRLAGSRAAAQEQGEFDEFTDVRASYCGEPCFTG